MKKIIVLFMLLGLAACSTQTAYISKGSDNLRQEDMQNFFVSGVGQKQTINAATVCGGADKVAKVEKEESALNVLLGVVTFGIYTPLQARVYCR